MCGIAGIVSSKLDKRTRENYVMKILKKQVHRGPDYTGLLSGDDVTLGHNRLKN